MAYPTGVDFKHIGPGMMGAQPINETSTTQKHPLGLVTEAKDINYGVGKFVYCVGVASTAKGDLCTYDSKNGDTARAVHGGSTSTGPAGVAMSANVAGQYGWYQIEGAGPVYAASVAADAPLYLTATAGQVDDTAVTQDLVVGLVARNATSSDYATCQIDHPNISVLGGASGTNTGDVTLAAIGSSANANGATLTGQILNLEPASASFGGIVTTGAQTIAGAKTFSGTPVFSSGTITLSSTSTNLITSATSAANASGTVGAFTLKPTATLDADDLVLDVQSAAAAHLLTVDLEGDVVAGGAITATGALTGTNGTLSGGTLALTATSTNLITSATAAATASSTVGAFTLKPTVALDADDLVVDVQSSAAAHLFTVDQEGDVVAAGTVTGTNITTITAFRQITLTAAGEAGDAIVVTGQVTNLLGTNIGSATQVLVRSLAVTDGKGDITVTAGTSRKVVNPATGENVAWIETTASGGFAVSIANDVAELTLVQATCDDATAATLALTFA